MSEALQPNNGKKGSMKRFCRINQKVLVRYGKKREKKYLKDGMFALEKLKKSVNMICTKLVIEIKLIIKKSPVGSL